MCLRLMCTVLCLPVLVTTSTIDTEPNSKWVTRQLGILKFEIEILKQAISSKKLVLQDLKSCTGSTLRILRNTDEVSTYPTSKLLRELIKLTELERSLYHSVRLHIQEMFPTFLIAGGPGKSLEMIAALRTLLRDITNVTVNPEDRRHNVSCEDGDIQRPRHQLVSSHNMSYSSNQSCSSPSNGIILLPGGSYVLPFFDHLEFCGQNNTLFRNKRLRRDPYKVVFYKHQSVLVESFTQRTKIIKVMHWPGGRDRVFARSGGRESSGISVIGGNVFIVSKYTNLEVRAGREYTSINKRHGRYHFADVFLRNTEPGSEYGIIDGEIVGQLPVLIHSSGMRRCVIRHQGLSASGYVNVHGDAYIAGPGNNRVLIFDKDCIPYDEYIQLPPRHYVDDIVGLGDVIMVSVYSRRQRYVSIYVKGSSGSPFSFNWD